MKMVDELLIERNRGIGIGLLIASFPIIITYIIFHYFWNENYDLSLFIVYSMITILALLIIMKCLKLKKGVNE